MGKRATPVVAIGLLERLPRVKKSFVPLITFSLSLLGPRPGIQLTQQHPGQASRRDGRDPPKPSGGQGSNLVQVGVPGDVVAPLFDPCGLTGGWMRRFSGVAASAPGETGKLEPLHCPQRPKKGAPAPATHRRQHRVGHAPAAGPVQTRRTHARGRDLGKAGPDSTCTRGSPPPLFGAGGSLTGLHRPRCPQPDDASAPPAQSDAGLLSA